MSGETLYSQAKLQQLVSAISLEFFSKPFNHQASFNSRLRSTGGRYHLKTHHLDFNPRVVELYGEAELIKVIKHELCHYHLHIAGLGYQHRDRDFKELLKKTGGTRFVPPLVTKVKGQPKHEYQCADCQITFPRQRRINTARFRCRCGGNLLKIK